MPSARVFRGWIGISSTSWGFGKEKRYMSKEHTRFYCSGYRRFIGHQLHRQRTCVFRVRICIMVRVVSTFGLVKTWLSYNSNSQGAQGEDVFVCSSKYYHYIVSETFTYLVKYRFEAGLHLAHVFLTCWTSLIVYCGMNSLLNKHCIVKVV